MADVTRPVGAITVPAAFVTADGNPRLHVKLKKKKGVQMVRDPRLLPNMDLKPEYSDLYAECFEEASVKFADKGLREVGAQAMLLSNKRIAAIEKAKEKQAQVAAAKPVQKARETVPVKGNKPEDWEAAFAGDSESDEIASNGPQWQIADDETLTMLKEAAKRPSQPYRPSKPQVVEMAKPEDGWEDGFSKRGRSATAPLQRPTRVQMSDLFNIPGLGLEPSDASGYALLTVPEGDLRFRFNWMLRDEDAGKWVIFVQDSRAEKVKDVRQYLTNMNEGAGELRMSDDPAELEAADMTMVNTLVNSFRFGDFIFLQFFLLE